MRDLALLELPTAGDSLPIVLRGTEEEPAIGKKYIDKMLPSAYCCRLVLSYPYLVIGSVLQTLSRSTSDVKILAY